MHGVPEAVWSNIEQARGTSAASTGEIKCVNCALEGVDAEVQGIYFIQGTSYCLRHALIKRKEQIDVKSSY